MPAPELRLVLAVSLDGRIAPPGGGAAQIGGRGDRRVLEEALAWADGCLIGARTLRLHGSTCLIHAADLLAERQARQQSPQPTAVVVSRRGDLDPLLPFFQQPLERWLLVAAPEASTPRPGALARVLPFAAWPQALAALAEAGLQRLLVLGGAQLAADLLAADRIDQLQLTLCPTLLGGPHGWMPAEVSLPANRWRLLEQRALEGEELLLRYGRCAAPG